jgi:hypothetical protein
MHRDGLLVGIFVSIEAAFAYSAFLPSIYTIKTFGASKTPQGVAAIREGEFVASAVALALGAVTSGITSSWLPLVLAVVAVVGMVSVYEAALAGRSLSPV